MCVCVPNLWVHPVLELLNPLSSPLEDRWPMISITIRVSIYFQNYQHLFFQQSSPRFKKFQICLCSPLRPGWDLLKHWADNLLWLLGNPFCANFFVRIVTQFNNVFSANITLRRGVIWDLAQSTRNNLNFPCALKAKSQITPLAGWCLRLTPQAPRAECAVTQSAQKKCALWVFLCALG